MQRNIIFTTVAISACLPVRSKGFNHDSAIAHAFAHVKRTFSSGLFSSGLFENQAFWQNKAPRKLLSCKGLLKAGNGTRTRDIHLGKVELYH